MTKFICLFLKNDKGNYVGKDISFSEKLPLKLQERRLRKQISRIYGGLYQARFPVKNVWNGHSLSEQDVPDDFKQKMEKKIEEIEKKIFSKSDAPLPILEQKFDKIRKESFYFLSCLHQDAPLSVGEKLLKNNVS